MRASRVLTLVTIVAAVLGTTAAAAAQGPNAGSAEPSQTAQAQTRQAEIEREQAEKAMNLHPYVVNKAERVFQRVDTVLEGGTLRWHPFFENAYAGGGFTLGSKRNAPAQTRS